MEETAELRDWPIDESTDAGRLASAMVEGALRGEAPGTVVARLANGFDTLFAGVEGRLLLRALTLMP